MMLNCLIYQYGLFLLSPCSSRMFFFLPLLSKYCTYFIEFIPRCFVGFVGIITNIFMRYNSHNIKMYNLIQFGDFWNSHRAVHPSPLHNFRACSSPQKGVLYPPEQYLSKIVFSTCK